MTRPRMAGSIARTAHLLPSGRVRRGVRSSRTRSSAPTFCSIDRTRFVQGIGTTGIPSRALCPLTHASATCAGSAPSALATLRTLLAIATLAWRRRQ